LILSPKDINDKIEIFSGDIRDPNSVRQAMEDGGTIFHLAALIGINFS
jgi:dTDP-glucose 4,6-dehydratase